MTELHVVLLLRLTQAEVEPVTLVLPAETGRLPFGVQRMRSSVEVFLEFQQQVHRQAWDTSLELVVKDNVGVQEVREEMRSNRGPRRVDRSKGCIGDAVGREHASRDWVVTEHRLAAPTVTSSVANTGGMQHA